MRVAWPAACGGSNVSQSPNADNQETINFYPEMSDVPGGKSVITLMPTPGVEARVSSVETPGRGLFYQDGRGFCVIGPKFYEVTVDLDRTYTLVDRGTVAIDANPATICGNGDGGGQLFITSGDVGYCYDLTTNTLTLVRASGNTMGAMLDGYFLVLDSATSTFYVSDLLDGSTWDPLQFAQRSIAPDRWVAMVVPRNAREIWLLGEETSEVWNNAGTFPFPFVPVPNALFSDGCAAPFSATDTGDGIAWVSNRTHGPGGVVMASGGPPQPVSTQALEWAMGRYGTVANAIGQSYDAAGHHFLLLTFPSENVTWALDLRTKLWAKRGTWISELNQYQAWRPRYHASGFGSHLALDGTTGTLYEVSESYGYDVDARPLRRLRRTPALFKEQQVAYLSCIELVLESGLGLSTGRGADPVVSLRLSRDGGKTWGAERYRSAGALGAYQALLRWWRCGSGRNVVAEFVTTDPTPFRIVEAYVDLRIGGEN